MTRVRWLVIAALLLLAAAVACGSGDEGEPTRYARGIYSIGLDGGLTLLAERADPVSGIAETYSATADGSTIAFISGGQERESDLYLVTPPNQPRLLATLGAIWSPVIAPRGDLVAMRAPGGNEGAYLHLVDTASGAVTPVPEAGWPVELAWSPKGDWLAMANSEPGAGGSAKYAIYILHPDGTGLRRLAVGGPRLAWSPDGTRLAFAMDGVEQGGGLYTTDLEGHVAKISDSIVPYDSFLTWSPDGHRLAFVLAGSQSEDPPSLRVLDVETGWEVFLAGNATHPVWSPDGSRIAFIRDGNLWVMNTDGSQQRRLTNPSQPFVQEPAWLPDGSGLFFGFVPPMAASVRLINPDGTDEVNLADGSQPVWSPDGTKIAFRGGGWANLGSRDDIYVMDSDGAGVHKIGSGFTSDAIPPCTSWRPYVWSPDGRFVVYNDDYQDAFMLAPADGSSEPEPLVQGGGVDWSPNGQRFVYSDHSCRVYIQDFPATGEPQQLSAGTHAVWSPDGQRIAFVVSGMLEPGDVYVINVDGTGLRKLMGVGPTNRSPLVWSPDGTRLAVTTDGLFVVDIVSAEKTKLSESSTSTLSWSPAGTQIAFSLWDESRIYIVNADGSGQPRLLTDGTSPSWSPDGSRIAFAR